MNTKIEWTKGGKTWNPIKARLKQDLVRIDKSGKRQHRIIPAGKVGYHCEHISEGCRFCYAESGNCRTLPTWGTGLDYTVPNRELVDIFLDRKVLIEPMGWRKPCFCFPCSMTDLFADFVPVEFIDQVFAVMALTPHITYQALTKRARRMREWFVGETASRVATRAKETYTTVVPFKLPSEKIFDARRIARNEPWKFIAWPLPNLWLGVSVENQPTADERIPELLRTPAALRFVSYEPALESVDFASGLWLPTLGIHPSKRAKYQWIDWCIIGGESGPNARPFNLKWARSTIRQFEAAGVPLFVKQLGADPFDGVEFGTGHPLGNDPQWEDRKRFINLKDSKGGKMSEWPEDLRVREFPKSHF